MDARGHDWPGMDAASWGCLLCGALPGSIDAKLACLGSAAEPDSLPCDVERSEERR